MVRWTEEEARENGFFRNSRGEWEQKSSLPRNTRKVSGTKRSVCKEPLGKEKAKRSRKSQSQSSPHEPKFFIKVVSYRKRDMDPDNLCPKYYIDEIRKAGYIPDDSSKYIMGIHKSVVLAEEEKTVIEIFQVG